MQLLPTGLARIALLPSLVLAAGSLAHAQSQFRRLETCQAAGT